MPDIQVDLKWGSDSYYVHLTREHQPWVAVTVHGPRTKLTISGQTGTTGTLNIYIYILIFLLQAETWCRWKTAVLHLLWREMDVGSWRKVLLKTSLSARNQNTTKINISSADKYNITFSVSFHFDKIITEWDDLTHIHRITWHCSRWKHRSKGNRKSLQLVSCYSQYGA